jgi:hypothetical protein
MVVDPLKFAPQPLEPTLPGALGALAEDAESPEADQSRHNGDSSEPSREQLGHPNDLVDALVPYMADGAAGDDAADADAAAAALVAMRGAYDARASTASVAAVPQALVQTAQSISSARLALDRLEIEKAALAGNIIKWEMITADYVYRHWHPLAIALADSLFERRLARSTTPSQRLDEAQVDARLRPLALAALHLMQQAGKLSAAAKTSLSKEEPALAAGPILTALGLTETKYTPAFLRLPLYAVSKGAGDLAAAATPQRRLFVFYFICGFIELVIAPDLSEGPSHEEFQQRPDAAIVRYRHGAATHWLVRTAFALTVVDAVDSYALLWRAPFQEAYFKHARHIIANGTPHSYERLASQLLASPSAMLDVCGPLAADTLAFLARDEDLMPTLELYGDTMTLYHDRIQAGAWLGGGHRGSRAASADCLDFSTTANLLAVLLVVPLAEVMPQVPAAAPGLLSTCVLRLPSSTTLTALV